MLIEFEIPNAVRLGEPQPNDIRPFLAWARNLLVKPRQKYLWEIKMVSFFRIQEQPSHQRTWGTRKSSSRPAMDKQVSGLLRQRCLGPDT